MKPIPLGEFARLCGGVLQGQPAAGHSSLVTGYALDNREAKPGDLFIAIKGERVDGHDFAVKALASGAVAALVERPVDGVHILVPNVVNALASYASAIRATFHGPVVAVTGSAGKTTTKELIAAALTPLGSVLKTEGNRNSEFTSPLIWAELEPSTASVVVEMGMRGFGQIAHLASFTKPTIGVITNIGHSHIELVGSREGVAQAKAELLEALESTSPSSCAEQRGGGGGRIHSEGVKGGNLTDESCGLVPPYVEGRGPVNPQPSFAILWAEDPFLDFLKSKSKAAVKTFGFSQPADCRITSYKPIDWRSCEIEGTLAGKKFHAIIPTVGRHFALNAAAAILVAYCCGVEPQHAASALNTAQFPPMRMEIIEHDGVTFVLDTYNASPSSVSAAIETLAELPAKGRRIAVLGEMRELGNYAEDGHRQVGAELAHHGIDLAVLYGEPARWIGSGAQANGMPANALKYVDSIDEISGFLKSLKPGDVVLIKGSRALEMERALDFLKEPVS